MSIRKGSMLVAQSCLTLCNPMDCSTLGSSLCGISQARILEWVAILFSRGSSWPRDQTQVPGLLHCRQIFYCLSHWGSPYICTDIHTYFQIKSSKSSVHFTLRAHLRFSHIPRDQSHTVAALLDSISLNYPSLHLSHKPLISFLNLKTSFEKNF